MNESVRFLPAAVRRSGEGMYSPLKRRGSFLHGGSTRLPLGGQLDSMPKKHGEGHSPFTGQCSRRNLSDRGVPRGSSILIGRRAAGLRLALRLVCPILISEMTLCACWGQASALLSVLFIAASGASEAL